MLRHLLRKPKISFLMEAHSGLSARIAEEAGFEGLWGSGLAISASHGVRDANELSVSEVVHHVAGMQDAVSVPILLDGDTGFGNFNNARRLVRDLERAGIGGVCMEDKLFPKTNSFVQGEKQTLADKLEFGLKIQACKEAQRTKDFVVVARLESFITGLGLEDALERAHVYCDHGADAILCHSKRKDAAEIEAFMNNWQAARPEVPVIIVPTTYPGTSAATFEEMGVSTVIWANHLVRSSITAMKGTCAQIYNEQSVLSTDKEVCTVKEVFRLQRQDALTADESRYLPSDVPTSASTRTYSPEHYLRSTKNKGDAPSPPSQERCCPTAFLAALRERGIGRIVGVPDSLLSSFTSNLPSKRGLHDIVPNEGAAIATATGYSLATGGVPYLQNSGLGNAVNPMLSLAHPRVYATPMLVLVGWRGAPGGKDEPQHMVQGECTTKMLDAMGIPWAEVPTDAGKLETVLDAALKDLKGPFALLARKGTFGPGESPTEPSDPHAECALTRADMLNCALDVLPSDAHCIATTGYMGRELYQLREERGESHASDFLNVGAMGHASSIALGAALEIKDKPIVCFDGDGAALMHLGSWCALGARAEELAHLTHVVFHNAAHESVGGQPTETGAVDLEAVARAVGYPEVVTVDDAESLTAALSRPQDSLRMVVVRGRRGCLTPLMRPAETSSEMKDKFVRKLRGK